MHAQAQGKRTPRCASIADRIVYTQIALDAIQTAPLQGIGAGNYPWYASDYLYYRTDYDLRGDNVHTVILAIASELGIVGTLLWLALISMAMVRGAWVAMAYIRYQQWEHGVVGNRGNVAFGRYL
jgi:O-antigen ligase